MRSFNQATIVGNVGKDPSVRDVGGTKVANFSVATTETWKDKDTGERKEATEWHNVTVWGGAAGVVESYVTKGSKIMVVGKIKHRSYEKNGETKYITEITVRSGDGQILLLGDGKQTDGERQEPARPKNPPRRSSDMDDDIPF